MSLKDKIKDDRRRVFINMNHFADKHTWNGIPFDAVLSENDALRRKNGNAKDISWDNNTRDYTLYVLEEEFPGRMVPNDHGWLDNRHVKIEQISIDMGMACIVLSSFEPGRTD